MASITDIYQARAIEHFTLDRRCARGYMRQKGPLGYDLQRKFDNIAQRCESSFPVYGTWKTFPVDALENESGIHIAGTFLDLSSVHLSKRLHGATHAVLMAFTLGMDYLQEANRIGAESTLEALMFDACVSALVESGADGFERGIVANLAELGFEPTGLRYSPGYGDLSLSVQQGLLEALDAKRGIGVYVTDDDILIPAKSITAILGARPLQDTKGKK